jgi:diguanylate cyclase (GGDEF)-like protein/PAS domain S-box-containing protein
MHVFEIGVRQEAYFRRESYNTAFISLMYPLSLYAMIGFVYLVWKTVRSAYSKGLSMQEQTRSRLILRGSLIGCFWALAGMLATPWVVSVPKLPASSISSYGILVFALFVRHAMVNYDFLSTATRRYEILFTFSSNVIVLIDAKGMIVEMNPSGRKMLGIGTHDSDWKGKPLEGYAIVLDVSENYRLSEAIRTKTPIQEEVEIRNQIGETFYTETRTDYIEVEGSFWTYITAKDITKQKNQEDILMDMAYRDSLTGLLNRRGWMDLLAAAVKGGNNNGGSYAVFLIDLDRFKWVNDTLGHAAGDKLLITVARRLKQAVPERAHLARMGGDEFVILLPLTEDKDQPESTAIRISEDLNKPLILNGSGCEITASIGIRICTNCGDPDVETVLRDADTAMYKAKQAGRNRYHIHQPNTA